MKDKKNFFIAIIVLLLVGISAFLYYEYYNDKNVDIEKVLGSSNYSYLSSNAKDYIRNYYYETGEVLLTEKNKIVGEAYLNPDYIEYLDGDIVSETGYIPDALTYDYNYGAGINSNDNLPSKYDSRNVDGNNYVTPLKKQYGELCWDYSFTSIIESKLLRDGFKNDASSLDLAERMIDYATSDPISVVDTEKNPYFGNVSLNSLADSGNHLRYSSVLVNGLFPIDEKYWKYGKEYMGKVKPEDIYDLDKMDYQVNSVVFLKDNNYDVGFDENTNRILKQYIMENGAVAAAIRVGAGQNFISYRPTGDEALNGDGVRTYLYYKDVSTTYTSNDHMVSIIGWNDDYSHNICILAEGILADALFSNGIYSCNTGTLKTINGAWIIKDSSSKAYQYVAYETVKSEYYAITSISLRDWDNVYSSSNKSSFTKSGNVYTFKKLSIAEKIKSIKFYSNSLIQDFDIYVNAYDGNGEKLLTSFSSDYIGVYTINIDDDTILASDKFSIKFEGKVSDFSVFTSNIDDDINLEIDDTAVINSFNYQNLLGDYQNVAVATGKSRNINDSITYVIKNSNGIDVTNLFNITRNYSVGNYIDSLFRFNKNIPLGEYTGYAYINGVLVDSFKILINNYMEIVSGEGTIENPYIITNPVQLNMVRLNKYNYYKLGNDIDLTYDTQNENGLFYNDGLGWEPINYSTCSTNNSRISINCSLGFTGALDGDNYKIIGLYINRPNEDVVGLFRNTNNNNYSGLNFRNLILKDVNITGNNYVGGLIGYAYGSTYERHLMFENISVSGSITGNNYVGGIIGYFYGGTGLNNYLVPSTNCIKRHCLINLFNSSKVSGNNYVGGIIGVLGTQTYYNVNNANWRSTIDASNWQNSGTITSVGDAAGFIGMVSINNGNNVTLNNSINTGMVKSNFDVGVTNSISCSNSNATYPNCNLILNNIYYTNDAGFINNDLISANNVKKYNIINLLDDDIYNSFTDFSTYYKKDIINGIRRIPFVKNAYVEYTDINDISINGSNSVNIYDYINSSNRIIYSIDDESIATIDENGNISPLKSGSTTIHITSYYDGYDNDINLVVDLSLMDYTITYDLNGGIATNPVSYNSETATFKLNNPTKEGYVFTGWTGSNGNIPQTEVTIAKGSTGNRAYTANWAPIEYTIIFNKNGSSVTGTMNNMTCVYGEECILTKNAYTKTGYSFSGWSLSTNGEIVYLDEASEIEFTSTEPLNLYAVWSTQFYTITYDLNGGTATNPVSYNVESNNIMLVNPTKVGYTFVGWTGSNGNTPQTEVTIAKGSTGNKTYTANWTPIEYTITFDSNGGSSVESKVVHYNNTVPKPANPTKENYTFKHWALNGSIFDFDSYITSNITLVAVWEKIELSLLQILTNNNYTITNNFVSGFNVGDSINSIKSKLNDSNITFSTSANIISTGIVIKKSSESYTVVIKGDINGDGEITPLDYVKIKNNIMGTNMIIGGEYQNAADYNDDGEITPLDYVKVKNYIMNGES